MVAAAITVAMSVVRIAVSYVGVGSGTPTCHTATSQPIDIASCQSKTPRASITTLCGAVAAESTGQ
jgi:hypothetical protein